MAVRPLAKVRVSALGSSVGLCNTSAMPTETAKFPTRLGLPPAAKLVKTTTILNPDRPELRPLDVRRNGHRIEYTLGLRTESRKYTSAAIAKRVAALVFWWHDRRSQYPIGPDLLSWLIRAAEESAVAEVYAGSLIQTGSCYGKLPKNFDSL